MADDIVSLSGEGLRFGRSPANGELLIGNGSGFNLSTLTAGSNVTITNSSGGISISSTNSGGTVTSVTGTAPITSTGGATPNIALTTPVAVQYGGTGLSTITSGSLMTGNGTGAVSLVAPGTSGNLLTSNGTTWASAAPTSTWTRIVKSSDQTFTSTTFANDSELQFSAAANKIYEFRGAAFYLSANNGGSKCAVNGPASPNYARFGLGQYVIFTSTLGNAFVNNATDVGASLLQPFYGVVSNGANAGTIAIQWGQAAGPSGTLTVYAGSWLEWAQVG